ncbi:MAG: hypothetical protein ACPG46_09120 [Thalassotalea sp.]
MTNLNSNRNMLNIEFSKKKTAITTIKNNELKIIDVNNSINLSHQYAAICRQYRVENKWILMINPEEHSLGQLNQLSDINTSSVLKVHANKVNVVLQNIESALRKGNCAAVVLCNPILSNKEIELLNKCTQSSQTSCIVIRDHKQLH